MDDIARRLEQVRRAHGWSGREFCTRAGVSYSLFSKIQERGAAKMRTETLEKLALAGGVPLQWVLRGEGEPDLATLAPSRVTESQARERAPTPLGALHAWPELLSSARLLAPELPAWVWDRLAASGVGLTEDPTPAEIADLGRLVLKYARASQGR